MPETRRNRSRSDRDLVRICWPRRESCGAAPVRPERTRVRSEEGTRHRRATRDRSSEIAELEAIDLNRLLGCDDTRWAVRVNRPYLERFFWFADVARPGFETCVFLQECERN